MKFLTTLCTATLLLLNSAANADDAMTARIQQALAAPDRLENDKTKDPHRKSVELMEFIGVEAGMRVMDVGTAAGYTAEILAAAVGPDGWVYAQTSEFVMRRLIKGWYQKIMYTRLANNRLPNVLLLTQPLGSLTTDEQLDLVYWGMNLHDSFHRSGQESVIAILENLKGLMKPGAILAVSDHVGIAGQDNEKLHRIETAALLDTIEKAGFTIEATSDLFANPADNHILRIFDDSLYNKTDRIIVKARKPAK